jgi:hypothetical protein
VFYFYPASKEEKIRKYYLPFWMKNLSMCTLAYQQLLQNAQSLRSWETD